MSKFESNAPTKLTVSSDYADQRIDNFLVRVLKGVPKSRIYRAIRSGEVRVNSGRVKAEYKLQENDEIRVPPIAMSASKAPKNISQSLKYAIENNIIYEDKQMVIINKPEGFAVHGGSGIRLGVIEALRLCRPQTPFLALAHRIDKHTSGCLLIAKKSSILKQLHEMFREKTVEKRYLLLVHGRCEFKRKTVSLALNTGHLSSGERFVRVSKSGKMATTLFRRLKKFEGFTLLEAIPITGRTHQIRVHAKAMGHAIVGDEKYGDGQLDKALFAKIPQRMYLHACSLEFDLVDQKRKIALCAVLDEKFRKTLNEISTDRI